jgi:hypothetical protein
MLTSYLDMEACNPSPITLINHDKAETRLRCSQPTIDKYQLLFFNTVLIVLILKALSSNSSFILNKTASAT